MPIRLLLLLVLALNVNAAVAFAQSTSDSAVSRRPYRGLFGPGIREEQRPPQLTFTMSVYSGLDDTTHFASGGLDDEALQTGRMHQGVQATFAFVRRRTRRSIGVDLASAVRYYSNLNRIGTQKHSGGIDVELLPSRRLTFRFAQRVNYSPSYQLTLGLPPAPAEDGAPVLTTAGVDYSVSREKQLAYGSFAGATYVVSPGRRFEFGYSLNYSNFFTSPDFHRQQAAAGYSHLLTSDIALRLGYRLGFAVLGAEPPSRNHDLDIGLNYNRSFAFSPRTALGFTSGSSVISTTTGRQFEVTGGVQLRRVLSPRWRSEIGYQRGLQSVDRVSRPFIASTVGGQIAGYFSARTSLRLAPSHTRGTDVMDPSRAYRSSTSQLRLDVAVSRHWAIYVEHFFYRYQFDRAADLPAVLATGLDRQGVRVGLALWAPLIR